MIDRMTLDEFLDLHKKSVIAEYKATPPVLTEEQEREAVELLNMHGYNDGKLSLATLREEGYEISFTGKPNLPGGEG